MDPSVPRPTNLLALAVLVEGGMALVAIGLGWLLGQPPTQYVRGSVSAWGWGLVGSLPLVAVMLLIVHVPRGPFARLNRVVSEVIVPLFESSSTLDFALISLLAGIGEELLFRGVIQARLSDGLSPAAGLVLASLLFGLAHTITIGYAVLATTFGLYLGALWLWSDDLMVAIVAHAVYDFVALVYLVQRHKRTTSTPH
jgi:membrane protease YdiL (CAAX protease family)